MLFIINTNTSCTEKTKMLTNCPICKKSVEWDGNPSRPFCSERCRLVDLGAWFNQEYQVPATEISPDEDPENNLS